jgi:hypothetical protein
MPLLFAFGAFPILPFFFVEWFPFAFAAFSDTAPLTALLNKRRSLRGRSRLGQSKAVCLAVVVQQMESLLTSLGVPIVAFCTKVIL